MQLKKSIVLLVFVNTLICVLYFLNLNPYQRKFILYPTKAVDSLKFSDVINSPLFKNSFKASLTGENLILTHGSFQAKTSKSDLIHITMQFDEPELMEKYSQLLHDHITQFFIKNNLKANNTEVKIFVANDIITLFSNSVDQYTSSEKNYLEQLGSEGQLIKAMIKTHSLLYVESRLNNIDIADVVKQINSMKTSVADYINFGYHLKNNSSADLLSTKITDKNDNTTRSLNMAMFNRSIEYTFKKTAIDISNETLAILKLNVPVDFKILNDTETLRKYSLLNMFASWLISTTLLVGLYTLLQLLFKKTRAH